MTRRRHSAAGDFDYDRAGGAYAAHRRADPRIAAHVHAALGGARTVVNVGAGAGAYEPMDRYVVAVEPSAGMRRQRAAHLPPAVDAVAESLPFDDDAFDAAMATFTVHQWRDLERGLGELRRVARGPVAVLTFTGDALYDWWLRDYFPGVVAAERRRDPAIERILAGLGGAGVVREVPTPADCTDGFAEAFFARPERLLDPEVRAAMSAFARADQADVEAGVDRLRADLASGRWEREHGRFRRLAELHGAVRLVVAHPASGG